MIKTNPDWKMAVAGTMALACCAPASAADVDPNSLLNPMAAVQRSSLSSFVDRPLFDPLRGVHPPTPVAKEPPPPPVALEAPPSLRVIGIVQGLRDAFAVISRQDANAVLTIRTGDHLGLWRIDVRATDLILTSLDGTSARYQLFSPK